MNCASYELQFLRVIRASAAREPQAGGRSSEGKQRRMRAGAESGEMELDEESSVLLRLNIIAGACLALGLRFAGSHSNTTFLLIVSICTFLIQFAMICTHDLHIIVSILVRCVCSSTPASASGYSISNSSKF